MPDTQITATDIALLRSARSRNRYADLAPEEMAAHKRVHEVLKLLGALVLEQLGAAEFTLKLTSGFHPESGVRGGKPKDLWFGVYRRVNEREFLGNPQLFMIVSERGVEYGFAPLTHPDDFSNQDVKRRTRQIAPRILELMPFTGTPEAMELGGALKDRDWYFRRKQRLSPRQSEFTDLDAWLGYLHSDEGMGNAGGCAVQYVLPEEVEGVDWAHELSDVVGTFRPVMERITPDPVRVPRESFADLLRRFVGTLKDSQGAPFQLSEAMRGSMAALKGKLSDFESVRKRPYLSVSASVGQGNWAAIPWFAILNSSVTRSTQEGVYVVILIAKDLRTAYLTLNQGTTNLVKELGQVGAQRYMTDMADRARQVIPTLGSRGFSLNSEILLGVEGGLGKNYEIGTIAHTSFSTTEAPSDENLNELLEDLLAAYDEVVQVSPPDRAAQDGQEDPSTPAEPMLDAYDIEDALAELFLDQPSIDRMLKAWNSKKNLILQGAPGVGKSFVAKRLAWLLLGSKDPSRIESVQFHQSYSYEDFVQGYRPDGEGGFVLRDGVFHRFCARAARAPDQPHVFIIDEINRGNLSKIFGEIMLLVEQDKRGPSWSSTLTYSKEGDAPFFVPSNVYLLGMMNTADRSLSLVDYALRRRFAFITLDPRFESPRFRELLIEKGIPEPTVSAIVSRFSDLNRAIGDDRANLGRGYRIGHSFFVPNGNFSFDPDWYARTVETDILPLLEEYWFDDESKVTFWREQLLQAIE